MSFFSSQYPLYYPQSISGYEKVTITTMTPTNMMETEQLIRDRFAFSMSSFGRMFGPPRITNEMRSFCKEWSEDIETPTPMHNDLHGVDLYFRKLWESKLQQ